MALSLGSNLTRSGRGYVSPVKLDLKFTEQKDAFWDDVGITHTRGSSATFRDSDGFIKYAPENMLANSEDIVNILTLNFGGSNAGNLSVTAQNSEVDPFGNTGTVCKLSESASNVSQGKWGSATVKTGETYVISVFVKGAGRDSVMLSPNRTTGVGQRFGIAGEGRAYTGYSGGTPCIEKVSDQDDGWFRISLTHVATSSTLDFGLRYNKYPNLLSATFAGNTNNGVLVFGWQIERKNAHTITSYADATSDSKPTPYKKTSGTAYFAPRFDHDKNGECLGYLCENKTTNYITHAIDLNSGLPSKGTGVTIATASDIKDPSGAYGTRKLVQSPSGNGNIYQSAFTTVSTHFTNGSAHTRSIFAKKAEMSFIKIQHYDGTDNLGAYFDLDKGVLGTVNTGVTAKIEDYGNGWYRCSVTRLTPSGRNDAERLQVGLATADNASMAYTGDGASGAYIWGGQLEINNAATSLIVTTGAIAVRNRDTATLAGAGFQRFYKDGGNGSWFIELDELHDQINTTNKANTLTVFEANNKFLQVGRGSGGGVVERPAIYYKDGGGDLIYNTNFGNQVQTVDPNASYKLGVALDIDNSAWIMNGHTIGVSQRDTSVPSLFSPTELRIGWHDLGSGDLDGFRGHIKSIKYYNRRVSDNLLERYTNTDFLAEKYQHITASYSLRSLSSNESKPVARVRRAQDNQERDFTAIQILDGTLENFCRLNTSTTKPRLVRCPPAELVPNPDFSVTTGWTLSGTTIENGKLNFPSSSFKTATPVGLGNGEVKKNRTYVMSFDVLDRVSGGISFLWIGGFLSPTVSANGSYRYVQNSGTSTTGFMILNTGGPIAVDNFSVKYEDPTGLGIFAGKGISTRKLGNYTGPAMLIRRDSDNVECILHYDDNDVISINSKVVNNSHNLFPYSEDRGQWSLVNYSGQNYSFVDNQADAFGTNTATKITNYVNNSSAGDNFINVKKDTDYTYSYYIKKQDNISNPYPTFTFVAKDDQGGTSLANNFQSQMSIFVDPVKGQVGYQGNGNSNHSSKLGVKEENGFWRVSATHKGMPVDGVFQLFDKVANTTNPYEQSQSNSSYSDSRSMITHGYQLEETVYGTLSEEKLTNGDFASDTIWGKTSQWTIANGKAIFAGAANGHHIFQKCHINRGRTYQLTFTVSDSSSTARIFIGSQSGNKSYDPLAGGGYRNFANGTHTVDLKVDYTNAGELDSGNANGIARELAIWGHSDNGSFKLDNVSLKEKQVELADNGTFDSPSSELVTNGTFDADSNWTKGTGWSISSGVATHSAGSASELDQAFAFQNGSSYEIKVDVNSLSGGTGAIQARGNGSTVSFALDSTGSKTFYYTDSTAHNTLRVSAGSSTVMEIDNVSIKEIYWEPETDWTISGGKANLDTTTGARKLKQNGTPLEGGSYEVTYTISNYTSGSIRPKLGASYGDTRSANGTYTDTLTPYQSPPQTVHNNASLDTMDEVPFADVDFHFENVATTTELSIDNVSVKERIEILQPYQKTPTSPTNVNTTGTTTNEPDRDSSNTDATTLGEFIEQENLIAFSSTMMGTGWSNSSAEIASTGHEDPFGGNTAISARATGTDPYIIKTDNLVEVGEKYVFSIYMKGVANASGNTIGRKAKLQVWFGVGTASGPTTFDSNLVLTDEWQRFELEAIPTGSGTVAVRFDPVDNAVAGEEVLISSPQLNRDKAKPYCETVGNNPKKADIHVVNWYGQGGCDFEQATASLQPRIVKGGELNKDSRGNASVYFDSDRISCSSLAGMARLDSYYSIDTDDDQFMMPLDNTSGSHYGMLVDDGDTTNETFSPSSNYAKSGAKIHIDGTERSATKRNDTHDTITGKASLVTHENVATTGWSDFSIGKSDVSGFSDWDYRGNLTEAVFYEEVETTPNIQEISSEIIGSLNLNLVKNGDFSNGTTGWTITNNAGGVVNLTNDGALRITSTAASSNFVGVSQSFAHTVGKKYKITFDYVASDSNTGNAGLTVVHPESTMVFTTSGSKTVEYIASSTATHSITFKRRMGNQINDFTIDNVKIQEVGTDGFVTKLYDQSGNNNHASQATATNQPKIVSGGTVLTAGGKPAIEFDGTNDYLPIASDFNDRFNLNNLSTSIVFQTDHPDQDGGILLLLGGSAGSNKRWYQPFVHGSKFKYSYGTNHPATEETANTGHNIVTFVAGASGTSGLQVYRNGDHVNDHTSSLIDNSNATDQAGIGAYSQGSLHYKGKFQEAIIYDSDQKQNREGIQKNQGSQYGITIA